MAKVQNVKNDLDRGAGIGRYVRLPTSVLNDGRLSANAVRVFGVIVDCHFEGSKISLQRIAERCFFSRSTARRAANELINADHIRNREPNGKCPVYEILTRIAGGTGTSTKSVAHPSQARDGARTVGGTLTKRKSLNSLSTGKTTLNETKDEDAHDHLIAALADCNLDEETAKWEAARLRRWFPGLSGLLMGHLRDAVSEKLADPIRYAEKQTQRGELPKRPSGRSAPPDRSHIWNGSDAKAPEPARATQNRFVNESSRTKEQGK